MIEPNTFILGDCLEVLEELPDGFADLALCDPPYGIKQCSGMGSGGYDGFGNGTKRIPKKYSGGWDFERPSIRIFFDILRVSKKSIIWGGNYFADMLPPNGKWLIWNKENTMPSYSDAELAWTNINGNSVKMFTYNGSGLMAKEKERYHPTQKPVALFVWCLLNYSKPGDLIIDPFCGSGTTALACHKTGRRFICIDKEPEYIEIARKRYDDLVAQQDLFSPPEPETKTEQEHLEI